MKIIGIIGRSYYNKDNQKIIQINEAIRKVLSEYPDIVSILLLPTISKDYANIEMGKDYLETSDKEKLDYILNKCDAFIVPGGSSWYTFDEYIMKHAIYHQKPLLGICAGFQAMCSMDAVDRDQFDMTKPLPIDNHYGDPSQYIHKNYILNNTLLKKIVGNKQIQVNSIHHSYIDFKMKNLIISSYSEDGIIEAVELPNHHFYLGVEWHPEYLLDDNSKKIFDYFIKSIT